jgi:hypothetical protein
MTRLIICLLVIGMLAAVAGTAWAQYDADDTAQQSVTIMPQWYGLDPDGNQSSVREYDGREYDVVDISEFLLSGLTDDALYHILLRDPISGDADAEVLVDKSYWLSFEAIFSSLTHRFADDRNALVVNGIPTFQNRVPWAPGDPVPVLSSDVLDVLSTDRHMMERNVTTIGAGFTPAWMGTLRLTGSFWREDETGHQILAFRSESMSRKTLLTVPIDRQTTETEVGFDGGGGKMAYAYRHGRREYSSAAPPDLSVYIPVEDDITDRMVPANNHTDTDEAVARLEVASNAWLTASWTDRQRRNETSGGHWDVTTASASFAMRPSRDLHITARWRDTDQDTNLVSRVPGDGSHVISRDIKVASLDASYYGIPRTVLRAWAKRRDVDRSDQGIGVVTEGEVAASSRTDTWGLGLTHRPMRGATLKLDWRNERVDDPAFAYIPGVVGEDNPPRPDEQTLLPYGGGMPKEGDDIRARFTFAPTSYYTLYADYNRLKEDRDQVNYHSKDKQWLVGGWAALSDRWSVHAEASRMEGDRGENWVIIGRTDDNGTPEDPTDDIPADLPWPAPEHVIYDYESRVYSGGVTFAASPTVRLFSNLYRTSAEGTLRPLGWSEFIAPDVINGVSPVNLNIRKYSVGVGWDVDPVTTLIVEAGRERWHDFIDSTQSGRAEFVTVSLRKQM